MKKLICISLLAATLFTTACQKDKEPVKYVNTPRANVMCIEKYEPEQSIYAYDNNNDKKIDEVVKYKGPCIFMNHHVLNNTQKENWEHYIANNADSKKQRFKTKYTKKLDEKTKNALTIVYNQI